MTAANWNITDHAKTRIIQRFNVAETGVKDWINARMQSASYITNAPDANGKMRRVFVGKGIVVHVSLYEDVVYTVIPAQKRPDWSETIRKVAEKELRKFNVKAIAEERQFIEAKTTIELAIIDVKSALLNARSNAKKNDLRAEYARLSTKLAEIERELLENRRSVVRMAESYSAIM